MPIPASLLERIETFGRNLESYLSPDYKETELRREFLDPFFTALGWDVDNRAGYAEAYKDVVHEESLKISGANTTAPDYTFRIGGTRKFFVEAKKPSVRIKDDPAPAAQLRRYSYTAGLPLGIVTDFHEFAIYDTRHRPRETDKSSAGRIFYCTFDQYPDKWDEISGIFSRESVLRGSFDKFAASARGKRGTSDFDDDFLADLEHWRDLLARNLALRNSLTQRDLNFAVQRILDRIIFLRIAEDRGIEPYGRLQSLMAGPKIYPRLCEIFERADLRYNSGLFHFADEKGRDESPDKVTFHLAIDDATLKEIIGALYWPKSPYAFAVIPADILGHIYEQFLGKIIHLTSDHRARVEEKPEVRKAGGVYYTPTYIVRYIVEQAVGPLVAGKTPKQVEKIKILDPACGSGSFLLGAYDYLLDWHLDYYLKHDPGVWAKKKNPPIYETAPNAFGIGQGSKNFLLTTAERKRILVNNLFGIDIDSQAVEVTKLSLLLKVLEGEARELQGKQLDFHRVLPDLGQNIKCGNSLIGSDFYQQPNLPEFDEEARYRINAFDWPHEFAPIMSAGGFDAVIGNPPYVLLQDELRDDHQLSYFREKFAAASYKIDTYHLFFETGLLLTRVGGRLGFITPSNFLTNNHLVGLRRILLSKAQPNEIVVVDGGVFDGVSVNTALTSATRANGAQSAFKIRQAQKNNPLIFSGGSTVTPAKALRDEHVLFTGEANESTVAIWTKCERAGIPLGQIAHVNFGKQLRDRKRFTTDVIEVRSLSAVPNTHRACYTGRDINRYLLRWGNLACLDDEAARSGGCWDRSRHRAKNKLLTRQIGRTPVFALDTHGYDCLNTVFMVNSTNELEYAPSYLLGVLNSRLLGFLWLQRFYDKRGTFPKIKGTYLKLLPIRKIAESNRKVHDTLVAHVDRMLKLHADFAAAKSPDAHTRLRRDIAATDRAINQLVYQLYHLTPDEITLVEQATATPEKPVPSEIEFSPASAPAPEAYLQSEADAAHFYSAQERKT